MKSVSKVFKLFTIMMAHRQADMRFKVPGEHRQPFKDMALQSQLWNAKLRM